MKLFKNEMTRLRLLFAYQVFGLAMAVSAFIYIGYQIDWEIAIALFCLFWAHNINQIKP